ARRNYGLRIEVPTHRVRSSGADTVERSVSAEVAEAAGTVLGHELAVQGTCRGASSRTFEAELHCPRSAAHGAGAGDYAVDVGLAAGVADLSGLRGSGCRE